MALVATQDRVAFPVPYALSALDLRGSLADSGCAGSLVADAELAARPGLLPLGLTVEDLRRRVSKLCNRVIGRVFRNSG